MRRLGKSRFAVCRFVVLARALHQTKRTMQGLLSRNMMRSSVSLVRSMSRRSTVDCKALGKQEFVDRIAEHCDMTKTAASENLNFILNTIRDEVSVASSPQP